MHKFGTQFVCQQGPLFFKRLIEYQGSDRLVFVNPSTNTNLILCIWDNNFSNMLHEAASAYYLLYLKII